VRPIVEGTVGGIYDFRFMPDFGQGRTVIQDAYVTGRFKPGFQVTAGKFKAPVGLERLQSANDIRSSRAPSRPASRRTAIWACRSAATSSGPPELRRGLPQRLERRREQRGFSDVDINDDKDWAGRVFAHPFAESESFALRGLGLGFAATWTDQDGTSAQPLLPTYRTPGQSSFFRYRTGDTPTLADGERIRFAPQFYYYDRVVRPAGRVHPGVAGRRAHDRRGPAPGLARHVRVATRGLVVPHREEAAFRGFKPGSVFSLDDRHGAPSRSPPATTSSTWTTTRSQAVRRRSPTPTSRRRRPSAWALGLNWYLNENVKWVLNYEQTSFDGGAPAAATASRRKRSLPAWPSDSERRSKHESHELTLRRIATAALAAIVLAAPAARAADVTLLNVSYDPTRELYDEYNKAFASTGRPRPARRSRSASRTAARASRRAP